MIGTAHKALSLWNSLCAARESIARAAQIVIGATAGERLTRTPTAAAAAAVNALITCGALHRSL